MKNLHYGNVKEFRTLEMGDIISIENISDSIIVKGEPYYNADAQEKEWEVETNYGIISVYNDITYKGTVFKNTKKPFLGLLLIMEQMIKKGIIHKDPARPDNILVYMKAHGNYTEGWYSQNIHTAASSLYNNEKDLEFVLKKAREHGIDTKQCFLEAALSLAF